LPDGTLGTAYEALRTGDSEPLLAMLPADFEWVEPELAGYPLSGVHRGPDGVAHGVIGGLIALFDGFTIDVEDVVEAGQRAVVTGSMRGRPSGADADWELPFAHVWDLDAAGVPVRACAYFDRSRLTLAAARRQLAGVADDLLEQAAEIRRQWARLGDALKAAGGDGPEPPEPPVEGDDEEEVRVSRGRSASIRLAAVDLAHEGGSREEVDAFLRDEHGMEDTAPLLNEIFGPPPAEAPEGTPEERAAALEATRLSRLFARNRS
jgi:ketosteroid isomerase-like protein